MHRRSLLWRPRSRSRCAPAENDRLLAELTDLTTRVRVTLVFLRAVLSGLGLVASLHLVRRIRRQANRSSSDYPTLEDSAGRAVLGLWAELASSAAHVGLGRLVLKTADQVGISSLLAFCCAPMPTGVAAMVQLWSQQRLSVMGTELAAAFGDSDASRPLDHLGLAVGGLALPIVSGWVSVIDGWMLCPAPLGE